MPRDASGFPSDAKLALANPQLRANLRNATTTIRERRAEAVSEVPDWQELRNAGSQIKAATMANLDHYLTQLESKATEAGATVHWARDGAEAVEIASGIARRTGSNEAIKVKSLTTDEIDLNEGLGSAGIAVHETDLAELIVQLGEDRSSHIVVPAIHRNRSEIRELFARTLGTRTETADPEEIAAVARSYLRNKFLTVPVAISGANFGVAETGSLCVVESEGNGRMCLTLPRTLITVMGIEKVIPRFEHLEVMLQLLARSATGERMNPYSSIWSGVTPGDGPEDVHLILLDNGRTKVLSDPVGREALHCIRCAACLNVCPVYERTGGHAYDSIYPGPIGAILSPQLHGLEGSETLPWASSLCGACYEVCPVKIDIPSLLVHLRGRMIRENPRAVSSRSEAAVMRGAARMLSNRRRYEGGQRAMRIAQRPFTRGDRIKHLPGPMRSWTDARDLAKAPDQTFREWWRESGRESQ